MPEKLIVNNFGPLKNIEISLKQINVFIGETASGKSILSKLSAIFTSNRLLKNIDENNFKTIFKYYDIDIYLENNSVIRFETGNFFIQYKNNKLTTNYPHKISELQSIKFDNIIDYLQELQLYLYDIICSSNKAYRSITNRWETICNYLETIKKKTNKDKFKKEFKNLEDKIIKFKQSEEQNGVFDADKELELAFELYEIIRKHIFYITETIYIPAERAYISTLSNSLFSIIREDIALPKCLTDFGAQFEQARNNLNNHKLDILNIEYKFENNKNIIHLPNSQKELQLTQVSSGMQAVIPMLLVLENKRSKLRVIKNCYVIEEPELNLFPEMQKKLTELIIEIFFNNTISSNTSSKIIKQNKLDELTEKYINKKDRLIITTHSPYILTTLDSLIQAQNTFNEKPNTLKEISNIISQKKWIDINNVSAYYLKEGKATDIIDYEMQSIGANRIDDISDEIGQIYDKLLNIMFDDE